MIAHLFKLIWNKKRNNILITIEILCSFLVLFAVVTMGIVTTGLYRQPLGFTYKDVWLIDINTRLPFDSVYNASKRTTVEQLLLAIRQLPEIEGVCQWAIPPYSGEMSTYGVDVNGKLFRVAVQHGSEEAKDVLGLQLTEGRWFEASDRALNWKPVVINTRLAEARFGKENPLGKNPYPQGDQGMGSRSGMDFRVIGVVTDFRKGGEFTRSMYTTFEYLPLEKTTQAISSNLLIKVRPGTTAAFKEKLNDAMTAVAKGWSFDIKTLDEMRDADFKPRIAFMVGVGLVAGFLLLMVALGLIGVLWQNVSRRTQEIGLRRALGSSERSIYTQILGELLVLTTFGLMIGTVIIVQVPLLDLVSSLPARFPLYDLIAGIPAGSYAASFAISAGLMYLLTLFCGLYPSLLAVEVQPAEALHYE